MRNVHDVKAQNVKDVSAENVHDITAQNVFDVAVRNIYDVAAPSILDVTARNRGKKARSIGNRLRIYKIPETLYIKEYERLNR